MKPELLMPAGNIEKLESALFYGADAVYFGLGDFSLRCMKKGDVITPENLVEAVSLAHKMGKKAYVTVNIFAFNDDIPLLERNLDLLKQANPDAIIFSDFGVYNLLKTKLPDIPLHVSTQTNTLNYEAVKFWQNLGVTRVILARELSLEQIKVIRDKVPNIELECFVHGSQCVSFSGRCLLSDYMTQNKRKSNHGECTQPCRWNYKLLEETRPNEYYDITEYERGTFILSPKDLCLVNYIPQFIDAGVDSLKVEGRTKSVYYVSNVARTYRKAIDDAVNGCFLTDGSYVDELKKVGNRDYTTGFFIEGIENEYSYEVSKGIAGATFLAKVEDASGELPKVVIKNKILKGDEIEVITPTETLKTTVLEVIDEFGNEKELGNTNDVCFLKLSNYPKTLEKAIFRTENIRE